jgi:perosamine synthetase
MTAYIKWPSWPRYGPEHEAAVLRVIRSGQLFAKEEVLAFEQEFAKYVGSKYAVGVGNATQGLHLALAALGIGAFDRVVVTPYSWISSASCVLMQNAIPDFIDIETESFGLCPHELRRVIKTSPKAVVLVHMFGLASKIDEILSICDEFGIILIEDASHAHGAKKDDKHLGTFGKIGVFSLHQRKAISAGEGGMLCTDDEFIYDKLKKLRSFGANQLSYNYRMQEFSAALGRVGLKYLDLDNELRKRNHKLLANCINSEVIKVIEADKRTSPVYYSNLLEIKLPNDKQEQLTAYANSHGIPLKRTWQPLNKHPHFKKENMPNGCAPWDNFSDDYIEPSLRALPRSWEYQTKRLFELDCHPLVSEDVIESSANIINDFLSTIKI